MKYTFAVLLGVVALVTGCSTTNVNTVERAEPVARPNYIADKRVITDSSLGGTIQVLNVNEGRVSGDHLKIQVRFENLKSKTVAFRYRVEWYDAQGMIIESPTDLWKHIELQGRESGVIEAVATSPKAVDFTLKFQEK